MTNSDYERAGKAVARILELLPRDSHIELEPRIAGEYPFVMFDVVRGTGARYSNSAFTLVGVLEGALFAASDWADETKLAEARKQRLEAAGSEVGS